MRKISKEIRYEIPHFYEDINFELRTRERSSRSRRIQIESLKTRKTHNNPSLIFPILTHTHNLFTSRNIRNGQIRANLERRIMRNRRDVSAINNRRRTFAAGGEEAHFEFKARPLYEYPSYILFPVHLAGGKNEIK